MWTRVYLGSYGEGYENQKKELIYFVHRAKYEVVFKGKTIKTCNSSEEAKGFIEEWIEDEV